MESLFVYIRLSGPIPSQITTVRSFFIRDFVPQLEFFSLFFCTDGFLLVLFGSYVAGRLGGRRLLSSTEPDLIHRIFIFRRVFKREICRAANSKN